MNLNQDTDGNRYFISHYETDSLRINQKNITTSCIVLPERLIQDWVAKPVLELAVADFAGVINEGLEVLILGTGTKQTFPSPILMAELSQRGIGLEVMSTAAACRTYNILMSEQRKVAAALIL